jgi:nicotinamide mononucleotide transporter
VPLLVSAGYYASAFMYVFYGAFTLTGFFVWMRARGTGAPAVETAFPDPRVVEAPADR